jgi:hypothetical protein
MKPKRDAGVLIIKHRTPDEPAGEESHAEGGELTELEEGIEDFKRAWNVGDMKRCAQIVKMVHDILHEHMDTEPKDEQLQEEGE